MKNKSYLALAVAATLLAGCVTMQNEDYLQTERRLAAAGFQSRIANTPAKFTSLRNLPQNRLVMGQKDGVARYLYADTTVCGCLYYGDQQAYDRYQRMALEQRLVDDQWVVMEWNADSMDWDAWGPAW